MSHRTTAVARFAGPSRFARTAAVAAVGLSTALALVAGCDKGSTNKSNPPPAAGAPTVGVVDYDRVFKDMQWVNEIDKDLTGTKSELKTALDAFGEQLTTAVNAEKAKIAKAGGLNDTEIANLNANKDLDKLKLSPELRIQLNQAMVNAYGQNGLAQQAQAKANQILEERRVRLLSTYRESLKPSVRRVAENNGLLMMVTPVDSVVFYAPSVDMTNKVIDDLRQAPPPHNLPEPEKFPMPKGPIQLTAVPTTAPTAPAVGPTTKGGK